MPVRKPRSENKVWHHSADRTAALFSKQPAVNQEIPLNPPQTKLTLKALIRYLPVSMVILIVFWQISRLYSDSYQLRGIMLFLLVIISVWIYRRWQTKRHYDQQCEQLRLYIESILTSLNTGHSLESALIEAADQPENNSRIRTKFQSATQNIAYYLKTGHTLKKAIALIRSELTFPDSLVFFSCLTFVNQAGTHLIRYIEQQHKTIVEKKVLIDQAESIQAQKKTEAGLLCLMPLLLAYMIIYQGAGQLVVFDHAIGHAGSIIGFFLSASATFITGLILTADYQKTGFQKQAACMKESRVLSGGGNILFLIYKVCVPACFTARLFDHIRRYDQFQQAVSSETSSYQSRLEAFFEYKCRLILFTLPGAGLLYFTGIGIKSLIPPVAICVLHDLQLGQWIKKFNSASQQEYPTFINLMSVLLQAGCSLHRALSICSDAYLQTYPDGNNQITSVLQTELKLIRHRLDMSWSGKMIMIEQASRCHLSAAKAVFHLFARFEETGNSHILHLISLQATSCWQIKQNALRIKLQEQSFYLIIPMMLNLLSVMMIAVLPSILMFIQ